MQISNPAGGRIGHEPVQVFLGGEPAGVPSSGAPSFSPPPLPTFSSVQPHQHHHLSRKVELELCLAAHCLKADGLVPSVLPDQPTLPFKLTAMLYPPGVGGVFVASLS